MLRWSGACAVGIVALGAAVAMVGGPERAQAQTARQRSQNPQQPAGQQPQPVVVPSPTVYGTGPFLRAVNPVDWTLNGNMNLIGAINRVQIGGSVTNFRTVFGVEQAAVVFPIMSECANAVAYPDKMTSELSFEQRTIDTNPVLLPGYADGTTLARWRTGEQRGKQMRLEVTLPMTCWELEFDEQAAMRVGWPRQGYPPEVQSSLVPGQYIESDDPVLFDLMMKWTRGRPKSVPPAMLAKSLAAQVIGFYQPDSQGYLFGKNRGWAGFEVQGAAFAVGQGVGSPYNMPALLCAMYRAAGLPARMVIGYDAVVSLGNAGSGLFIDDPECRCPTGDQPSAVPFLNAWVEFYLYDERANVGQWIPVDVLSQRRIGSRAPSLKQPWQFFGNFPCGEQTLPIAFQYHPPTTVVASGPPTLWGWLPQPSIPISDMWTYFDAMNTPKRAGD